MKRIHIKIGKYLVLVLILLCSCAKNELGISEYIEFIRSEKNGLSKEIRQDKYKFKIQYEPAEYLALKELRGASITPDKFDCELQRFKDYFYLDLCVSRIDGNLLLDIKDSSVYEGLLNHFAFNLAPSVFIVQGTDTLRCLLYEMNNPGSMSPEYHFQMMFEQPNFKNMSAINFIYSDSLLYTDVISLPILLDRILDIPQIKI